MRNLRNAFSVLTLILCCLNTGCQPKTEQPPAGEQKSPEASKAEPQQTQAERVVNIYVWKNYIPEETLTKFTKETGIKVNLTTYLSNEEMLTKLEKDGLGKTDLIFPSDYMVQTLVAKGLLDSLHLPDVTSFYKLEQKFRSPLFDPGNRYSIAYTWGTSGLVIRSDKMDYKTIDRSWKLLFEPPAELKGKISMLQDMRETIGAALKYLDYSANTTNPDEIAAARDLLLGLKKFGVQYTATPNKALFDGALWVSHTWSGDAVAVRQQDEISYTRVKYFVPKEGAIIFVDNMCIPKNAPNVREAYEFMNFVLLGENAVKFVQTVLQPSTSHDVREILAHDTSSESLLNDDAIYPSEKVLNRCEFLVDVGDAIQYYQAAWQQITAP